MGDSLVKGSAFNFINTAFKLSAYAGRVYESESDHGAFVRMIESVRHDLAEVERLLVLQSVKTRLINTPGKLSYIRGAVINAKTALNEIGKWVDRAKADEGTEIVTFENRVQWIFNDHGKLVNQQMELSTCQQDLSSVLAFLSPLEQTRFMSAQTSSTKELNTPEPESAISLDDVISPWQRRRMAREAGKSSTQKEPSREAPGVPSTTPTTSSLIRRPIARKRVGSGNGGQISKKEQRSPEKQISTSLEPPRLVESEPEVGQTPTNETNSFSNSQSLEISNLSRPTSSDMTKNTNVPIPIPTSSSEVSTLDKTNSPPLTTPESHTTRESLDALPPRPNTSTSMKLDSSTLTRTPPLKTPRTIQTWPSTTINPTLFTAREARRVPRPRPFHLPTKSSPHPPILSIGHSPVPSPSNSPEMTNHSTKSHARNHSTSLTTLPIPSYPPRLRSLSATNLLGPINPFEYPPDSAPTSPELEINNTTPPIPPAPTQKTKRSESMSRSQEVKDVATELLRAQSKKRNSLEIPKQPLRKPKSFNRPMELPTGFLSLQPVTTSPPIKPLAPPPAKKLEQRSFTEPVFDTTFQTIESSHNPPPEVVDTAYLYKSPNPPARPNPVQDQFNRHAISWPHLPKNAHELPSNERPPSMLYTNQIPSQSQFLAPSVSSHTPMNTSFYAPSPRLYHPTSTASLPGEKGWDLRIPSFQKGKSTKTVAEGRRNNRRALMDLMERGSYG